VKNLESLVKSRDARLTQLIHDANLLHSLALAARDGDLSPSQRATMRDLVARIPQEYHEYNAYHTSIESK
jgi:hypothetical protein